MSDKKVAKKPVKKDGAKAAATGPKKAPVKKAAPAKVGEKKVEKKEEKKEKKKEQMTFETKSEGIKEIKIDAPPTEYVFEYPENWEEIDWKNRDDIIGLFPKYIQAQLAASRGKPLSRTVDIYPFDMKAPLSTNYLLYDAQLLLEPNKKQCLVGDAGCGKSTFFAELAKGGIKEFPKHLYVYHCKEIELSEKALSVVETVVRSHNFRNILLACQDKVKALIEESKVAKETSALKDNLEFIQLHLGRIYSDQAYDRASKMLRVLGFDDAGQKKSTNALSGGLRMRVALCAAFFVEADILLLDEPTNHLDFPSVLWLENRLRGYRASFILVSHDRDLLQNVCTSVITIEDKKLLYNNCGFAEYERKRAVAHKKKSEEIDKFMARNRNVDFTSPLAREKAEKKAWSDFYQARMILLAGKFTFPDAEPLKNDDPTVKPDDISLINVKDVTFTYKESSGIWIFKNPINLNVTASTRMGVMGPNGAGKSTLLKLLTDKLKPVTGEIARHTTAQVAYFAQHHVQDMDVTLTPMEYMIQQFPLVEKTGLLRSHLAKVGIVGDKADTRMASLSGGLRSCVAFAKITYVCPHLLIMDEPTNFLDLESIDSLIAATNKYKGALLLVSHNRGFLLKCAKQYLSVVPGRFDIFDELKKCERATYQFIEEMESGVKVSSQNLVQQNPSADASLSVRTGAAAASAAEAMKPKDDGVFVISSAPKPVAEKKKTVVVIPREEAALVGKTVTAVWAADGQKYAATVLRNVNLGKVEVQFNGYPDKVVVLVKDLILPKK